MSVDGVYSGASSRGEDSLILSYQSEEANQASSSLIPSPIRHRPSNHSPIVVLYHRFAPLPNYLLFFEAPRFFNEGGRSSRLLCLAARLKFSDYLPIFRGSGALVLHLSK